MSPALTLLVTLLMLGSPPPANPAGLPCGSPNAALLVDALSDPDPDVRVIAADLLGTACSSDCRVVAALVGALGNHSESWRVRAAAAGSLRAAALECPEVLQLLVGVALSDDAPWRLRVAAAATIEAATKDALLSAA